MKNKSQSLTIAVFTDSGVFDKGNITGTLNQTSTTVFKNNLVKC